MVQRRVNGVFNNGIMRTRRLRTRDGLGYTLIELLAVLVIIGSLSAMAMPKFQDMLDKARVGRAIGDLRAIQAELMSTENADEGLPATLAGIGRGGMLDPWGNPYVYVPFGNKKGNGGKRKDRFLVPLNSTFDLLSMGKDGGTSQALTASAARDDIIRADDGGYIGLAEKF